MQVRRLGTKKPSSHQTMSSLSFSFLFLTFKFCFFQMDNSAVTLEKTVVYDLDITKITVTMFSMKVSC